MLDGGKMSTSLQVQSVLYGNTEESFLRAMMFTVAALKKARSECKLGRVRVAIGDCSEKPVLSPQSVKSIESLCAIERITFSYTHFGANLGSAGGHNRLAKDSKETLLLICNPDLLIQPQTIANLVKTCFSNSKVGIAEAKQIPIEHPKDFNPSTFDTSWSSTACALTPRAIFESLGGFDAETFFLYCDDVDYSWRVRQAGYRCVYVPSAIVFHDKKLNTHGEWVATASEGYYSAEAALLLTYKWSRADLTASIAKVFQDSDSETYHKALLAFRQRATNGQLPTPTDSGHKIAQFKKGNYAKHRF